MADRNDPDAAASERPRPEDEELPENGTSSQVGEVEEDQLSEDDGDDVEDELEAAREHADPTRGDKQVDGGDRVSTEEGGNPQE